MLTQKKLQVIFSRYTTDDNKPLPQWLMFLLTDLVDEIQSEQEEKIELKADKSDIKMLIERSDEKFAAIQKEMNTRFEALQKEMNTRFESVQKQMDARFDSLEKRFHTITWMIGIGFTSIFLLIGLINFLK